MSNWSARKENFHRQIPDIVRQNSVSLLSRFRPIRSRFELRGVTAGWFRNCESIHRQVRSHSRLALVLFMAWAKADRSTIAAARTTK